MVRPRDTKTVEGLTIGPRAALVIGLLIAGAVSVHADPLEPLTWERAAAMDATTVRFARRVSLDSIGADELLGGVAGRAVSAGTWTGPHQGALALRRAGARLETRLTRSIPGLWRVRLPAGAQANDLDVQLRFQSTGGEVGYLVHERRPDSRIRVQVAPTVPVSAWVDDERAEVAGGAAFELDLADAIAAGRYEGQLIVMVSRP